MKYLLTLLLVLTFSLSYSQDTIQKVDTVQTQIIYLGDTINPSIVKFDGKTRVLFTYDEVKDINKTYRLVDILEDVVEKYGIETDFEVGLITSLENEITVLENTIKVKDHKIQKLEESEKKLIENIQNIKEQQEKSDTINENKDAEIKNLKKSLRKQKIKTIAVTIVGGVIIVAMIIVSI